MIALDILILKESYLMKRFIYSSLISSLLLSAPTFASSKKTSLRRILCSALSAGAMVGTKAYPVVDDGPVQGSRYLINSDGDKLIAISPGPGGFLADKYAAGTSSFPRGYAYLSLDITTQQNTVNALAALSGISEVDDGNLEQAKSLREASGAQWYVLATLGNSKFYALKPSANMTEAEVEAEYQTPLNVALQTYADPTSTQEKPDNVFDLYTFDDGDAVSTNSAGSLKSSIPYVVASSLAAVALTASGNS